MTANLNCASSQRHPGPNGARQDRPSRSGWLRAVRTVLVASCLAVTLGLAACGGDESTSELVIYNGQHEELTEQLTEAFTEKTGIEVSLRSGEDADLANQIREEGDKTSADVFLTEEPGPVAMLAEEGLLEPVATSTLDQVRPDYVPSSGDWVPYAGRVRVIYYNPDLIAENELPDSILGLADPQWKGKFAYAPSGAFAGTVAYLIETIGEDRTLEWLKKIKTNGIDEQKNGKVRDTVEAGQHPFGLSNHYYWWMMAQEKGGPDEMTSRIHYFDRPDAGGLVMPSGAAVLRASDRKDDAAKFLEWLVAADGGQEILAGKDAELSGAQYPMARGLESRVGLMPLERMNPPKVDPGVYGRTEKAKELMVQAGLV